MEFASMLAGEPFTDHPQTVCPVIGSFLRAYNDSIEDERRQDLYAYAAGVVGSRESGAVERARAERVTAWTEEMRSRHWTGALIPQRMRAFAWKRAPSVEAVGTRAVHAIRKHTGETHALALALIDELLTITAPARGAG